MAEQLISEQQLSQQQKVWLISGCSTGFGREIAEAALRAGYKVVVTARQLASINDFAERYGSQVLALSMDITDAVQIDTAVDVALAHFGRIDVLVNNAGYGYVAAVEEGEDSAVRDLFETNFFGALALSKKVIPHMRARGSGRIINNSSQAGLMANPGTGYYSASKYALEGLMEALGKELEPFNIQVISVQPGAFRTDWAGRSMQRSGVVMEEYQSHVGERLAMIAKMDGLQPGDPVKGAEVFVMLAECEAPPVRLVLGRGVLESYREKLKEVVDGVDKWEEVSVGVDFVD